MLLLIKIIIKKNPKKKESIKINILFNNPFPRIVVHICILFNLSPPKIFKKIIPHLYSSNKLSTSISHIKFSYAILIYLNLYLRNYESKVPQYFTNNLN